MHSIMRTTCVVQGFGNVGAWAAEILSEMGGRIIAASDASGCIHNEKGLDVKALRWVPQNPLIGSLPTAGPYQLLGLDRAGTGLEGPGVGATAKRGISGKCKGL